MAACWGGFADDCDGITQKVNESNAKRIAFGLLFIIFIAHAVNYYMHGKRIFVIRIYSKKKHETSHIISRCMSNSAPFPQ